MCIQDCRMYTCGCKNLGEFRQCAARAGTNVKCNPVTQNKVDSPSHMCSRHMVNPGNIEMHRLTTIDHDGVQRSNRR